MSELPKLVRALERAGLGDWVARETVARTVWLDGKRGGERVTHGMTAQVHRDVPAGRGSATLEVGPGANLVAVVDDAASRALAAVGTAWRSPPPAASARVDLADPAVSDAGLAALPGEIADEVRAAASAAGGEIDTLDVMIEREDVALETKRGLDARWTATRFAIDAVMRNGIRVRLSRRARRRSDLAIADAVKLELANAMRKAHATDLTPGRYPVVMLAGAFLHGGRGLLEALVGQADPALERQGLVRYRPGQAIAAGAGGAAEPLTVSSDGTVPFGLRSAPLDDGGIAIRRFELITRGVARGLALDAREAALRGEQPNGGVRGLVVAGGDAVSGELVAPPFLLIEEVAWLDLAPITGRFRAGIALAKRVDATGSQNLRGGIVRGDAIAALALGRRSKETTATAEYRGPAAWALGELDVD